MHNDGAVFVAFFLAYPRTLGGLHRIRSHRLFSWLANEMAGWWAAGVAESLRSLFCEMGGST